MKIGILGTGMVGRALAGRLIELDHGVMVGARSTSSESLAKLADLDGLETGSFADAATFGDLLINATGGIHSIEAIASCEPTDLAGKTLLDVANMLELRPTGPPVSLASVDNCLGAQIQKTFPDAKVVKSLNTMNCNVMVDPSLVAGDHVVFVSGDDSAAKDVVVGLLRGFGWRDEQIVDLGGIESAAGPEMIMPLWLSVMFARGGFDAGPFNFAVNSG